MKEMRINFRCEVYTTGETWEECREKFENMGLFSADALEHYADVVEVISEENAETGEDVTGHND